MTVSDIAAHFRDTRPVSHMECTYGPQVLDLIADWRAMRVALLELLDTDSDRAYANCAAALNTLRLKP